MKCNICLKEFSNKGINTHIQFFHKITSKEYYDTYLKKDGEGVCPMCGKESGFIGVVQGYHTCCCKKCASAYGLKKSLEKYGVENISQVPSIRNKMSNGIKAHWSNMTEEEYNQRISNISNGTKNSNCWEVKDKNRQKFADEHNYTRVQAIVRQYGGNTGWLQNRIVPIIFHQRVLYVKNSDIPKITEYIKTAHIATSKSEKKITDFIKSFYSGTIKENTREILPPKEIDIYLPDLRIAIEFNGIYYHSIQQGKNKDYHLDKSLKYREQSIRLIHIYEFEDFDKQMELLKDLINGSDNYNPLDFNKNNLLDSIPKSEVIYDDRKYTIYGAGRLYDI